MCLNRPSQVSQLLQSVTVLIFSLKGTSGCFDAESSCREGESKSAECRCSASFKPYSLFSLSFCVCAASAVPSGGAEGESSPPAGASPPRRRHEGRQQECHHRQHVRQGRQRLRREYCVCPGAFVCGPEETLGSRTVNKVSTSLPQQLSALLRSSLAHYAP